MYGEGPPKKNTTQNKTGTCLCDKQRMQGEKPLALSSRAHLASPHLFPNLPPQYKHSQLCQGPSCLGARGGKPFYVQPEVKGRLGSPWQSSSRVGGWVGPLLPHPPMPTPCPGPRSCWVLSPCSSVFGSGAMPLAHEMEALSCGRNLRSGERERRREGVRRLAAKAGERGRCLFMPH